MMNRQRLLLAALLCFATMGAHAEVLEPGRPAPAAVVQGLQAIAPVTVGAVAVRPVTSPVSAAGQGAVNGNLSPQAAPASSGTTLVVRASDNLVGTSTNDLVVMYADTDAVLRAVVSKAASVKAYADLGMVVVHVSSFDQIPKLQQDLAQAFPTAKFDLPVRYFPNQVK
jgi:hypothetical protein